MRLILIAALWSTACATSYRPKDTGPSAFAFTLTPEQCAQLRTEARAYRATERTGEYVAGAGAVLTGVLLAAVDAKKAPAIASGVTLAASGVSVFTASQVTDLEAELEAGGCR